MKLRYIILISILLISVGVFIIFQTNPEVKEIINIFTKDNLKFGDNSIVVIQDYEVITDSVLTNVTAEGGDNNFTHLEISDTAPYDSLVGYWNFDGDLENTELTTAYEWTGYSNGVYVKNATSDSSCGLYDSGVCLNGLQGSVNLGEGGGLFDGIPSIAVGFWVKFNREQITSGETILSKHRSGFTTWVFTRYGTSETTQFSINNGTNSVSCNLNSPIQDTDWHHIFGVYNGTNAMIYHNGVLQNDIESLTGNVRDLAQVVCIGQEGHNCNVGGTMNGSVDDVMIFNTFLTAQQIEDIYNNQSARFKNQGEQNLILESNFYPNEAIYYYSDSTYNTGSQIKFDIENINNDLNILDAKVYVYFEQDIGIVDNDTRIWRIDDQTWGRTSSNTIIGNQEKTNQTDTTIDISQEGWVSFDVTELIINEQINNNNNFTIRIEDTDFLVTEVGTVTDAISVGESGNLVIGYDESDFILFVSAESSSINKPYLKLKYDYSGNNRVNVSTTISNQLNSKINLTVGYYDGSWHETEPQTITSLTNHTFEISGTSTSLTLNYTFIAGDYDFTSPIISGDINYEVWNEGGEEDTSFTVSLPIGYTQINFSSNSKTVTNLNMEGQDSDNAGIEITNTGDQYLNISFILNQTLDGFIVFADIDNNPIGAKVITNSIILLKDNLASSGTTNIWTWVNWTEKVPQTNSSKLNITSVIS